MEYCSLYGISTVLIVFIISHYGTFVNSSNFTEFDLHEVLFKKYNPNVMPNRDKTTELSVRLDMYLMSIDNINEKRQTITIKAFLESVWTDEYLVWETRDYPGVSRINVQDTDIWIPDLALHDTFDKPTDLGQEGGKADVRSNGQVTIWPYKMYTVGCKIFIKNFPFDKQECSFDFLSWTNPSSVLSLNSSQIKADMSFFTESGEWELVRSEVKHERRPYGDDFWDHILFVFELQRKSLFHALNVMLPVFCISILNVACFLLPSEGGERVTLSISVFLTLAVFLTTVNSYMPESSDEVATFSIYVGLQLFGSAFTIFITILSLYIFYKDSSQDIPRVLKSFVKICCIFTPKQIYHSSDRTEIINGYGDTKVSDKTTKMATAALEDPHMTWKMVSRAIDKLCLISAISWHTILIATLMINIS